MAPPPDNVYFPPLGGLLEGETALLSWKLIASALVDTAGDRLTSAAVTEFLKDPFVLELLKNPATTFAPSTAQSAAALETRTAAIHVTPSSTDKYDLKTIQADARWLSKTAAINEVAALRIVVVELQSRPHTFLASPLSSQDATNVRKAASGSSSSSLPAAETTVDADVLWTEFNTDQSRQRRLLATYLSERRALAKSTDHFTSLILHSAPVFPNADTTALPAVNAAIETLRSEIVKGSLGQAPGADLDGRAFLKSIPTYVAELRGCMQRAGAGIQESLKCAGSVVTEELAHDWVQTALAEAVHFLSVIFLVLQACGRTFLSPAVTAEWFSFVGEYGFLDGITPGFEAMAELILPLKTLVCVNSLILLNLNRAIGYLDHDLELEGDEEPYINDTDVLDTIHGAIVSAAEGGLATASPVFLSWSLILHRMDVSFQERTERRDLAQNQRAQDGFELDNQPFHIHQSLQPRGRRSSVGSIVSLEPARYDGFLNEQILPHAAEGEPLVPRLAMAATDQCQVYDVVIAMANCAGGGADAAFRPGLGPRIRLVFLELLTASFPIVGYQADPLSALLSVLSGGHETWDLPDDDETVARAVLKDSRLLQFYVQNSLNRFPYEFTPFVSISRLLAACTSTPGLSDIVVESLLQTPSLTFTLPPGFEGYAMIDDVDHATATMQLTEDIPLFPTGASRKRLAYYNEKQVAVIPAGSYGRFMIDGSGIVNIDYEHSTIALLGKRLDANLSDDMYEPVLGFLQQSEVAEAIRLLAALVRSEVRKASKNGQPADSARASEAGLAIVQEASRDLEQAKDIVSVICDTLDNLIQDGPAETDESRMAVLAVCVDFLLAILPLCPGRVWSYMARCQLLNTESSAGRLCILTGASDVVSERFNFLNVSIRFLSGLVQNAMNSAVQRKVATKPNGRSNQHKSNDDSIWLGTSDKTLTQVSLSIAQTVVDVYENTSTWKFASEVQRASLVSGAIGILQDIVVNASSLESPTEQESLVACFEPAAQFIIKSFLSSSSSSLRFQPLLTSLLLGLELPQSTLYPQRYKLAVDRVVAALELSAALLKVTNHVDTTGKAPELETQIFQIASLPARLCALSDSTLRPALDLLTDLIVTAAARASEPPSLLGYLGPQISRSFLGVLLAMDKPFKRPTEAARIWKFFSTILRHRQQWMANCLLTGKTPREALQTDGKVTKLSSDSALAKAKEALKSIATLPHVESLAMLDFFAAAQNYWPWTIFAIRGDNDYLDSMRAYVRDLQPAATTAKTDAVAACNEARIAAYIAESFAMQLYHMRQMGTEEVFARDVVQDIDYYIRDGVAVGGYNASLHANFQRNFGNRYTGCSLDQFKRSMLQRRDLGPQFYYALDLADRMLSFDAAWTGSKGFQKEMQTANVNLSLVDAQIALFHAWEVLLLELSVCLLPKNRRLPVVMLQLAEQCLAANQNRQGPELIFVKIAQSRANLALLLLQRLAEYALLPKDVSQLLLTVWTSIHSVENPWSVERTPYFRTLLRILYIVLRGSRRGQAESGSGAVAGAGANALIGSVEGDGTAAAAAGKAPATQGGTVSEDGAMVVSTTQTVLNVLDRVVAHGFRALVTIVHDEETESRPEDLALLTAVLQACLSTPGMSDCQSQVLNIMASHDVLHVATSLFSWSDKLLVDDRDPVYGELSLLFLLELSALPVVAEQLACDGFLSHLTSAGLAAHMRRPGVSPFSDVAAAQRCYSIWAKAVLPLLLNILIALGTSIAPEIAYVLNQFPTLLETSVQRLEAPGLSRTSAATLRDTTSKSAKGGGGDAPLTLLSVNEVHSLALLTRVLEVLRVNHARDIAPVAWDGALVLESVDFWLSRPRLLRERLVPLGAREGEWRSAEAQHFKGLAENRLEEKVLQLMGVVKIILSDDETE
ncbi:hypothetical protein HMPREF1624_06324 [Sporothrix schenckii ATCC 58251]|uniref:Nucleoporin NUP188 n=1 Tax=Sporothrix schenckii (strain ATCC 58251 / de Perez 2211183) TaxID=1391915 RepID=U7PN47_SPOS1|nr:hypothetical protein HMPREF1624_06324 [Sporothrix schenckii ATCC 58251]